MLLPQEHEFPDDMPKVGGSLKFTVESLLDPGEDVPEEGWDTIETTVIARRWNATDDAVVFYLAGLKDSELVFNTREENMEEFRKGWHFWHHAYYHAIGGIQFGAP